MPSSKKARGRVRRAAKEAKAAAEEGKEEQAVLGGNQDGSLEAQMQRLTINNLLRESDAVQQCRHHGMPTLDSIAVDHFADFMMTFESGYFGGPKIEDNLVSRFHAGVDATRVKFVDILEDDVKLRNVVSCYVASAVQSILNGNDTEAHYEALFANILEQFIATYLEKTQPRVRWQRLCA